MVLSICACDTSISSDAPYTAAILTTIDIASCAAGPRSPASIARSCSLRVSISPTIIREMRKTCLTVAAALVIVAPSAAQRGQSAAVADARARGGPLAHPPARLQRDVVDRSGIARGARAAGGARDQPSAIDAAGGLHDGPGSRHRGRAIRGRRI